jgi:hypothetical protein
VTRTQTYAYEAYGLVLRLPFPCPALAEARVDARTDVEVVEGPVPSALAAPAASDGWWDAEAGRFLIRGGPRAGRFLVEQGRVVLERSATAEPRALAAQFVHRVLPAVLRERGLIVLHANAAVTPSGAVALAGEPGAGKSTQMAALLARGCAMVADDLVAVRMTGDGGVEVLPGAPFVRLYDDSARAVGLAAHAVGTSKAVVPIEAELAHEPTRLRALYVIRTSPGAGEVRLTRLDGVEKFFTLLGCLYGPVLPDDHRGQFSPLAALAERVTVIRAERPSDRWSVDELAAALLEGGD